MTDRSAVVLGRCVAVAAIALLATTSSLTSPAARAQSGTSIDIVVVASPLVEPGLSPRLVLSTDATDMYCGPGPAELTTQGPAVHCTDLPDGDYQVAVAGVADPADVHVECSDIVATLLPNPRIGSGFTSWVCVAYVSPPGVVIGPDAQVGETDDGPAPPAVTIRDADGVVVSDGCTPDDIFGNERAWCAPLPEGSYVASVGPGGDTSQWASSCHELPALADSPAPSADFEITAERRLWSCANDPTAALPLPDETTGSAQPTATAPPEVTPTTVSGATRESALGSLIVAGVIGVLIGAVALVAIRFVRGRRRRHAARPARRRAVPRDQRPPDPPPPPAPPPSPPPSAPPQDWTPPTG
jgi:hypothetical protein